jgi:hypothetical protein
VLREQNAAAGKRFSRRLFTANWIDRAPGKSSNLYLGFQCFSADTVTSFSFATCFDQLSFPDFQGDIVRGVDISIPSVTLAKFSVFFIWFIRNFPPSILMHLAPSMKGLVVLRRVSLNDVIELSYKTDPP